MARTKSGKTERTDLPGGGRVTLGDEDLLKPTCSAPFPVYHEGKDM
jgi:hypothetical protein